MSMSSMDPCQNPEPVMGWTEGILVFSAPGKHDGHWRFQERGGSKLRLILAYQQPETIEFEDCCGIVTAVNMNSTTSISAPKIFHLSAHQSYFEIPIDVINKNSDFLLSTDLMACFMQIQHGKANVL